MDVSPFLDTLRRDLTHAAEAAGPDGRQAAERMLLALDPAVRLALLEVLSQAAAEITADLPAGTVEVRLRGRDPELVVQVPPAPPLPPAPPPPPAPLATDDGADDAEGGVTRVTLRLPEPVKARAEELATRAGLSLNAWIVQALRRATAPEQHTDVDVDITSFPLGGSPDPRRPRRVTGWI